MKLKLTHSYLISHIYKEIELRSEFNPETASALPFILNGYYWKLISYQIDS